MIKQPIRTIISTPNSTSSLIIILTLEDVINIVISHDVPLTLIVVCCVG